MKLKNRTSVFLHSLIAVTLAIGFATARAQVPERGSTLLGVSAGAVSTRLTGD
jgi:hypothetical protein